jgi:hypothetical protein
MYVCVCVCLYVFVCVYVCVCVCVCMHAGCTEQATCHALIILSLSVSLSVSLCLCLSVCLSVCLSLSIYKYMQDAPNTRLNALITKYQATGMLQHVMLTHAQGCSSQPLSSVNPL